MSDHSALNHIHGIWRIVPSMLLSEIIAQSGFRMQILDCEHGSYDFATLKEDIIACQGENCQAFVRVSGLNKVEVQRCLDLGANGIVFPQLVNYDDFKLATEMINYAPEGVRGFNPFVRASGYGHSKAGVNVKENAKCMVIIETLQAVADLDHILTLPGIDMVYIGSYDLSAQLDCIGQMQSPKLLSVVQEIISKCHKALKPVGIMVNDISSFQKYKNAGIHVFIHTVDSYKIKEMFTAVINTL
jgi:2-keto-3-deoxy-L-rhamnonate aldolase RhmA